MAAGQVNGTRKRSLYRRFGQSYGYPRAINSGRIPDFQPPPDDTASLRCHRSPHPRKPWWSSTARGPATPDGANCIATRAIVEQVNWPCDVLKNYFDINLGCSERVSSGIDWVFSQVEEAIILEDDCLPNQSFFPFCEDMLCRYRSDNRIMHISGNNFQQGQRRSPYSYYFSRIAHIWGWATWRRAWEKYDVDMKAWPEVRSARLIESLFSKPAQVTFWDRTINQVYQGHVNTWDAQWVFANWLHSGPGDHAGGKSGIKYRRRSRRNAYQGAGMVLRYAYSGVDRPVAPALRFPQL